MMKRSLLLVACVAVSGCLGGPEKEVAPKEAAFVTDDCALIGALGKDHYKFTRDDPPLRVRLNGEDLPWRPSCDFPAMGFNLVVVSGPEGLAATQGMGEVTFTRPRYDAQGALVRTSMARAPGSEVRELCRVEHEESGWKVGSCGPDPRETQPRAAPPNPADQTPDGKIPAPADRQPTARDVIIPDADPGQRPGSGPN
jgi:hypothetical protein